VAIRVGLLTREAKPTKGDGIAEFSKAHNSSPNKSQPP
jgi:hypothetical protein